MPVFNVFKAFDPIIPFGYDNILLKYNLPILIYIDLHKVILIIIE